MRKLCVSYLKLVRFGLVCFVFLTFFFRVLIEILACFLSVFATINYNLRVNLYKWPLTISCQCATELNWRRLFCQECVFILFVIWLFDVIWASVSFSCLSCSINAVIVFQQKGNVWWICIWKLNLSGLTYNKSIFIEVCAFWN